MVDNHKIKNIYYMLAYACQNLSMDEFNGVASEEFDNIHNFYANIIIIAVEMQVKRGLYRDYVPREEVLSGLRGRISVAETIKRNTQLYGKLACAFDEFTEDSAHNQILKCVIMSLLRHEDVEPEPRNTLRRLSMYFTYVSDIRLSEIRWDALKFHRSDTSYSHLMGICRFIVEGLLLTMESGEHKLAKWVSSEEKHVLYEKFLLAYYKRHHNEYSPGSYSIDWNIDNGVKSDYLPKMKPDIILKNNDGKKLIIDAKYCKEATQVNIKNNRKVYISDDLYQIYAYVKNSDKGEIGKVAGVLLYAMTDEEHNEELPIDGNRISIKTLNLNQAWDRIKKQLDELVTEWLG